MVLRHIGEAVDAFLVHENPVGDADL